MPSLKGMEACITWLRSKMADPDSLESINAERCLNIIRELRNRLDRTGAQLGNIRAERDRLKKQSSDLMGYKAQIMIFDELDRVDEDT